MNATETVEDVARRFAAELIRLGEGLGERGITPLRGHPGGTPAVASALAAIDQLTYERRILGQARRVLDRVAEESSDPALRRAAGQVAQAIVDEIGHSVADEPALGPTFRDQLAQVTEWLEACPLPTGRRR